MKFSRLLSLLSIFIYMILSILQPASIAAMDGYNKGLQVASIGFSDDFEAATLGGDWSTNQTYNGVIEASSDYGYNSNRSAFLGQKVAGAATATLHLSLDLTGKIDVFLDFWARSTGGGAYRRVFISDDNGTNWKMISELSGASSTFSHHVFDIANAAEVNGLSLNNKFQIIFYFSHYDAKAGDGFVIDDVRMTTRSQEIASFPLAQDSFEVGIWNQGLYPQSYNEGTIEFNTDYVHLGGRSVFLGQKVAGAASASVHLLFDLTGQTDVLLDFWSRPTGDGAYRELYISDDNGANLTKIANLDSRLREFEHKSINIAAEAQKHGLTLNNKFRIIFSFRHYNARVGDGFVIDDLKIVRTSLSGKVYNQAATNGNEVVGAFVEACSADNVCQMITTNADGSYGFGDLATGTYALRALPPAGNNSMIGALGPITLAANTPLANQDIILPQATGTPAGTAITPRVGLINGVPSVFWRTPITLTQRACAGGTVSYQLYNDGVVVRNGNLTEVSAGNFSVEIAPLFPLHGTIQITVNIVCAGQAQEPITFNVWIDPSGVVVNTAGQPIQDATVTLYRADTANGPFTLVPSGSGIMSPANRVNPMKTNDKGAFGWDVIAGFYKVRAEKAGCTAPGSSQTYNETMVLTIPPPVTDLRVVLFCGEQANQIFLPFASR